MTTVLSFGPAGAGKVGWFNTGSTIGAPLKDGYKDARPGTPDYEVPEKISVFKVGLTAAQGVKLQAKTEAMRQRIISGKEKYTVYVNDTCAETARQVLYSSDISTPDGRGLVRYGKASGQTIELPWGMGKHTVGITIVNPYMWHKNFSILPEYPSATGQLAKRNPAALIGKTDPFF